MPKLTQKAMDRRYFALALKIVADFGAVIAVPVVLLVLLGNWLDEKIGQGFLFKLLGFVLAAIVSGRMVWKKAKAYSREYENIDNNKKL